MKLNKTKTWIPLNIALIKWSSVFMGIAAGIYFYEHLKDLALLFFILSLIVGAKPMYFYWIEKEICDERDSETTESP